jgi:hypothetical protein
MDPKVTDNRMRSGHRHAEVPPVSSGSGANAHALPEALADEHARIVRSRSAARRVLARGRARRRVVPPLVAGSGALLGSTMIGAWVFGQAPVATTPATTRMTTAPTTTASNPDEAQLSLDVAALARIRQALAADDAAISGLTPSAGSSAAPVHGGHAAASGGAASSPVGGVGAPAGGASALVPLPTLPGLAPAAPLGPLPTVPTTAVPTTAPPTHTTTGATVAVP